MQFNFDFFFFRMKSFAFCQQKNILKTLFKYVQFNNKYYAQNFLTKYYRKRRDWTNAAIAWARNLWSIVSFPSLNLFKKNKCWWSVNRSTANWALFLSQIFNILSFFSIEWNENLKEKKINKSKFELNQCCKSYNSFSTISLKDFMVSRIFAFFFFEFPGFYVLQASHENCVMYNRLLNLELCEN